MKTIRTLIGWPILLAGGALVVIGMVLLRYAFAIRRWSWAEADREMAEQIGKVADGLKDMAN